jgi:hemolysin III
MRKMWYADFTNRKGIYLMYAKVKLRDRRLPDYTRAEEIVNMITHIAGGVMGIAVLVLCILRAAAKGNPYGIAASAIYGAAMICTFGVSSVYHGLAPGMGKKVMQVIDHCTIYFLIAGTYSAVVLSAIRPLYPALGWGLFLFEWALALLAATLTAIDLKKYEVFSMVCYIGMGWAIIPFWRQTYIAMTRPGFLLLLIGGIAYTIGSVLYGLGVKRKWMHSVFHIFVVVGALLQYFAVLLYAI